MSGGPDRLLRGASRLLPAGRREWGRAMRAELAALDRRRWSFALSCTRAVVSRSVTLPRVVRAGGLAVIATEALLFVAQGRTDLPLVAVWAWLLATYTIALLRLTAHRSAVPTRTLAVGAGSGALAAPAWLAAAALDHGVPGSSGPAVVAIAAAAICAAWAAGRVAGLCAAWAAGRVAGLCAAAGCALLIAVMIDGPLRLSAAWVSHSAPPVYPPAAPVRLVDSIGVWVVGCLLAAALTLAIRLASADRAQPEAGPVRP